MHVLMLYLVDDFGKSVVFFCKGQAQVHAQAQAQGQQQQFQRLKVDFLVSCVFFALFLSH